MEDTPLLLWEKVAQYDRAEERVRELFPAETPEDRWAREYLLDDWPDSDGHWAWLIEADEKEIRDCVADIPCEEDRPDLYEPDEQVLLVTVVETGQGVPRANIEGRRIKDLTLGRYVEVREVEEDACPPWGTSWWREEADGLRLWKEHWDTSD